MSIVPTNQSKVDPCSPDKYRQDKNEANQRKAANAQKAVAGTEWATGMVVSSKARQDYSVRQNDITEDIGVNPLVETFYLWGYIKDILKGPGRQVYTTDQSGNGVPVPKKDKGKVY